MKERISILVVEDHRMFSEALVMLLEAEDDFRVAASVTTAEDALESLPRIAPDVILMDVNLPGMDGIEATRRIRRAWESIKVIVISAHEEPEVIVRAMDAGAFRFVPKTETADQLVRVIRRAASGAEPSPGGEMRRVQAQLEDARRIQVDGDVLLQLLSPREIEILQGIAQGKATAELAASLRISPFTVGTHVKNILGKLGVHSRLEAVTFGLRHGLIGTPGEGHAAHRA